MAPYSDKDVVEYWLRLHNRLTGGTYQVESWPDDDSSKKNVDALCRDAAGRTLAIEHTLIEPYARHKADTDRFLKTLAVLENDARLVQPGYLINVSQAIGAIPTGIPWHEVPGVIALQLAPVLPGLAEGVRTLTILGSQWSLDLRVSKIATAVASEGYFLTSRMFPDDFEDLGKELMLVALSKKIPKLAAAKADKRILLLEKDAIAGNVEEQFRQVPREGAIVSLLGSIDEIWTVDTSVLESEQVIFTNQIEPMLEDNANFCSLHLVTDEFWKVRR